MDITLTTLITFLVGAFVYWRHKKNEEKILKAKETIKRDTILYNNIKKGLREYKWFVKDDFTKWMDYKDKDIILENAHIIVYRLDHFAEFRLGFYIKEIDEYGIYGSFDGFEEYYRSDNSFTKEESLMYDDDEYDN